MTLAMSNYWVIIIAIIAITIEEIRAITPSIAL